MWKKFLENAHRNYVKLCGSKQKYCFKCLSSTHLYKECPKKRFNDKYSKQSKGAFAPCANSTQPNIWVCDSGASYHMTANKQYFISYNHFSVPIEVSLADSNKIYVYGS